MCVPWPATSSVAGSPASGDSSSWSSSAASVRSTPEPSSVAVNVRVTGVRLQPVPAPPTLVTGAVPSTSGGGPAESVSESAVALLTPQA